jgi:hypothetical protein
MVCVWKVFKNLNLIIISKNNKLRFHKGSPIGATLANIYILDFDQIVYDKRVKILEVLSKI